MNNIGGPPSQGPEPVPDARDGCTPHPRADGTLPDGFVWDPSWTDQPRDEVWGATRVMRGPALHTVAQHLAWHPTHGEPADAQRPPPATSHCCWLGVMWKPPAPSEWGGEEGTWESGGNRGWGRGRVEETGEESGSCAGAAGAAGGAGRGVEKTEEESGSCVEDNGGVL